MTTTVIETCRVAPPPGEVAEQSLPLTFFDITWLHFQPMPQLLFYEFPCSKQHFSESVVPKLKQSLSKTLKYFVPLSCNLIYPLSPEKLPEFRYFFGDSVSFTVAESSNDFDDLVGNHADYSADRLHCFVPRLPPIVEESDRKFFQVFAAQVTLFVGRGVVIGITTHHSVSDAPSFLAFITSWASISKLESDEFEPLPIFDRSVVKYPKKLDSLYWGNVRRNPLQSRHISLPTNRIRDTFVFRESEIKKLKGLIQSKVTSLYNISSFVAIAAYIWTGVTKSLANDDNDDEEPVCFLIPTDLRARLDPPVPENYFGNCLSYALARVRRRELVGDGGLFLAAEAIAADIKKRTSDKKILEGAEKWSPEIRAAVQKPFFSVAGSTRLDLYGADFGWGKARKQEILSIDGERYAMTLCKAREFEGGLEVCLSLPKQNMEVFHSYFNEGII